MSEMTYSDRSRLGKSILAAVAIHLVLAVGTALIDFSPPLPDYIGPVFVELDIPQPEPVVEPPPPPPPPPPPTPVEPRVEPEPRPAPTQPAPTPEPRPTPAQPAPSAPAPAPRTETPAEPAPPVGAPPQEHIDQAMAWLHPGTTDRSRPQSEPYDVDPRATAADGDFPDWAGQVMADAGIPTAQMDSGEVIDLAKRVQSDPAFRDRLRGALAAIDAAPAQLPTGPGTRPTDGTVSDAPATDLSDGSLQWSGADGRGGVPSKPQLTAAMFGGTVPARIEFVVTFDVDGRGQVVPGSIAFAHRSGYTRVNEEVRRTVAGWTFQPKPGTPVESAVFTLIVYREDVL